MLKRILDRIKNHKVAVEKHSRGELSDEEFEVRLFKEIEYLQNTDFEEKLSKEILEEEEKLSIVLLKIKEAAQKNNIDKKTLQNIILSEMNQIMIEKRML